MIALGIRYLTKYSSAYDLTQQKPEWPPHPGRVFMAMAAAHFETGEDAGERRALEWLESASPPKLTASGVHGRTTVRAYVPVNDVHGGIVSRTRQDRVFSRQRPHDDTVFLLWDADPESTIRAALDRVCRKVTRVGHSSSAVQMWVVPEGWEPDANWVPAWDKNAKQLRVAGAGTMQSLANSFNQSKRPVLPRWQSYTQPTFDRTKAIVPGPFDSNFLILTKQEGPALGLEPTLRLMGALRNAAMKAAGANPPEWLTGHDSEGKPSLRNHVAFFPLAYVGSEFADAHILGIGIAIPRELHVADDRTHDAELRRVLGPLFFDTGSGRERTIRLWSNPPSWEWELSRETREQPPVSLRQSTWARPSRTWASVTPVVLHHHAKKNKQGDVERIVGEAFVSAGFPRPAAIETSSVSCVQGAGHAMSMPPFTEGGGGLCRYQTHVWVEFPQPVEGPLLVGRGRFRGYGLFRPLREDGQ